MNKGRKSDTTYKDAVKILFDPKQGTDTLLIRPEQDTDPLLIAINKHQETLSDII